MLPRGPGPKLRCMDQVIVAILGNNPTAIAISQPLEHLTLLELTRCTTWYTFESNTHFRVMSGSDECRTRRGTFARSSSSNSADALYSLMSASLSAASILHVKHETVLLFSESLYKKTLKPVDRLQRHVTARRGRVRVILAPANPRPNAGRYHRFPCSTFQNKDLMDNLGDHMVLPRP